MWQATPIDKQYKNGVLIVFVEFTDDNDKFTESFDMTGGSSDVLDLKIQTRLATLNQTEKFASEIETVVEAKQPITEIKKEPVPVVSEIIQ